MKIDAEIGFRIRENYDTKSILYPDTISYQSEVLPQNDSDATLEMLFEALDAVSQCNDASMRSILSDKRIGNIIAIVLIHGQDFPSGSYRKEISGKTLEHYLEQWGESRRKRLIEGMDEVNRLVQKVEMLEGNLKDAWKKIGDLEDKIEVMNACLEHHEAFVVERSDREEFVKEIEK